MKTLGTFFTFIINKRSLVLLVFALLTSPFFIKTLAFGGKLDERSAKAMINTTPYSHTSFDNIDMDEDEEWNATAKFSWQSVSVFFTLLFSGGLSRPAFLKLNSTLNTKLPPFYKKVYSLRI